jgi:Domain of unknown function (DUF4440)
MAWWKRRGSLQLYRAKRIGLVKMLYTLAKQSDGVPARSRKTPRTTGSGRTLSKRGGAQVRRVVALMCLCLGLTFVPSAHPQGDNPTTEQTIKQMERDLADADRTGNVDILDQFIADDWIILDDNGGEITKKQYINTVKSGTVQEESVEIGPMDVSVFGKTAVVLGSDIEEYSVKRPDASGKSVWVHTGGKFVWMDVWVKQINGKWQEVRSQIHQVAVGDPNTSDQKNEEQNRTAEQSGEPKGTMDSAVRPSDSDTKVAIPKPVIEQQVPSNAPEGLFPSDSQLVAAAQKGFQGNPFSSAQVYGRDPETTFKDASNCLGFAMVFVGGPLVMASRMGADARSHFGDFPNQENISQLRGTISLDLIFHVAAAFDFSWEVALTQGNLFVRPFGVPTYESNTQTCFDGESDVIHFGHYKFNLTEAASRLDWSKPISLVVRPSFGGESDYQLDISRALGQAHR